MLSRKTPHIRRFFCEFGLDSHEWSCSDGTNLHAAVVEDAMQRRKLVASEQGLFPHAAHRGSAYIILHEDRCGLELGWSSLKFIEYQIHSQKSIAAQLHRNKLFMRAVRGPIVDSLGVMRGPFGYVGLTVHRYGVRTASLVRVNALGRSQNVKRIECIDLTKLEGCWNFDQIGAYWGVLRALYLELLNKPEHHRVALVQHHLIRDEAKALVCMLDQVAHGRGLRCHPRQNHRTALKVDCS